jgi:hypothetical protein
MWQRRLMDVVFTVKIHSKRLYLCCITIWHQQGQHVNNTSIDFAVTVSSGGLLIPSAARQLQLIRKRSPDGHSYDIDLHSSILLHNVRL